MDDEGEGAFRSCTGIDCAVLIDSQESVSISVLVK